ncbi:MAG: ribosome maturation factor RimM [Thermomicrobiales bacterium]
MVQDEPVRAPAEDEGPVSPLAAPPASTPAPVRRQPRTRPATPRTPPRLVDTAGPEPGSAPSAVRLTIGTILGPHGVRGEFKVRLQTDDPEHLLTIKRMYLGDEAVPRTVLSARLHAGQALLRLQGISTPETVDRFRGAALRIRGSDARPLASNEYFLYQIIGLEAVDETGQRLGIVSDLLETGANDVIVITPDGGGADLLIPSHPDSVVSMDPAAGRIVVRLPRFYGE